MRIESPNKHLTKFINDKVFQKKLKLNGIQLGNVYAAGFEGAACECV